MSQLNLISLMLLLIGIICSCQFENKPTPTKEMNKIAIVQDLFFQKLWNDRKMEVASEIFTEDFWTESEAHQPSDWVIAHGKGPASMIHHIEWWLKILPDATMNLVEAVEDEDKVIYSWILEGTMKGNLLGQEPNNQRLKILGNTVSYFEGNKIKKNKTLLDKYGLMQQIGRI